MDLIPNEVLIHIFAFLDAKSLVRCGAVSKTWNYLSRDNSLWKELYYTNFDLPQQELNKCSGSEGYTFVATIGASKDKDSLETEESIEQKEESKETLMEIEEHHNWKHIYEEAHNMSKVQLYETMQLHQDEVLALAFSQSGKYIASASRDNTCNVWEVKGTQVQHLRTLTGDAHEPFGFVTITPDDKYVLASRTGPVASYRTNVRVMIWNIITGELRASFFYHPFDTPPVSFQLFPSKILMCKGLRKIVNSPGIQATEVFVYDIEDAPRNGYLNPDGNEYDIQLDDGNLWMRPEAHTAICTGHYYNYIHMHKIWKEDEDLSKTCMAFNTGRTIHYSDQIVLCKNIFSRNITRVFSAEKELHPDCIVLQECGAIVGTVFSEDNRYLFVNMRPFESKEMWTPTLDLKKINSLPDAPLISQQMEIHMWDLKSYSVIRRFSGHYAFTSSDNPFIIYPAVCKNFVASGGEDGNVYVWHVHQGTLVKILKGHENVVNVVSFHPHNPYFIASASDDLTVRIWK